MKTRFWTNWALPVCREAWLLSLDAGLVFKPAAVVETLVFYEPALWTHLL